MDSSYTRTVLPPKLLAVSAGVIYSGSSGVYAFDVSTGSVRRRYSVPLAAGFSVYDNTLFGSWHVDGGRIATIRLANGAEIWQAETNGRPTAAPTGADGLAFACTIEGDVLAFDARDGAAVWSEVVGPIRFSGQVVADGAPFVAPAVNAPDVPRLYALDARTGQQKWSVDLTESTTQPLAVHAGVIYICTHRSCAAFRANDGAPLWRQPLDGAPTSGAVLSGVALYLTEEQTRSEWSVEAKRPKHLSIPAVTALDAASGDRLWRRVLSDGDSPPHRLTAPACAANRIFFGADDGILRAMPNEGNEAWRFVSGGDQLSAPLISADEATVYVGSNDGLVHAVDTATGTPKWRAMTDTKQYDRCSQRSG